MGNQRPIVALSALMILGTQAPPPAFEVATIKPHNTAADGGGARTFGGSCHGVDSTYAPNATAAPPPLGRCIFARMTMTNLISAAYAPAGLLVSPYKQTGGPAWGMSDYWDVEAKAEDAATATHAQLLQMLQTLLADKFKLQFHHKTTDAPGFAVVVARGGFKVNEDLSDNPTGQGMTARGGEAIFVKASPAYIVQFLSGLAGSPLIDKTGLTGLYTFKFKLPPRPSGGSKESSDADGPSIFTLVQEQLGLRLEAQKVPTTVIVIDRAEKPSGL